MICSTCRPSHARGLKRGRGTLFGLISGVFEPDFDVIRRYMSRGGRNVESDTLHRGRDSGLWHGWVSIDSDTHKGQSLT